MGENRRDITLKIPESEISAENPWSDDVLQRSDVAHSLMDLIRDQNPPFVISLHGQWGTGKSFLLTRWRQDLKNNGFKSIYFNAWEDDFYEDPLIAIIGQLSDFFAKGKFKDSVAKVQETAKPLLTQGSIGVLNKLTGVNLNAVRDEMSKDDVFQLYTGQRKHKQKLQKSLSELASLVNQETKHPLVFIIDELDRCRPLFAIALLERVKHIFSIPHIVFVFGINRDELCAAIRSVYGITDADTYLRRFFDLEFILPEIDSASFCTYQIKRFQLEEVFGRLSNRGSQHTQDLSEFKSFFPSYSGRLGLSLRDIEYCIRALAYVGICIKEQHFMHPVLISLLITLRLKNNKLYKEFINGNRWGYEVMDFIDKVLSDADISYDEEFNHKLNVLEAYLYLTDHRIKRGFDGNSVSYNELIRLDEAQKNGSNLEEAETQHLSKRTVKSEQSRVNNLTTITTQINQSVAFRPNLFTKETISYLAGLIELHTPFIRR